MKHPASKAVDNAEPEPRGHSSLTSAPHRSGDSQQGEVRASHLDEIGATAKLPKPPRISMECWGTKLALQLHPVYCHRSMGPCYQERRGDRDALGSLEQQGLRNINEAEIGLA